MKKTTILLLITLLFISCCKEDVNPVKNTSCNQIAQIIQEDPFNTLLTDNYFVQNVTLNDNCLEINISSSGCNPDNWTMNLYSHNSFNTVFPLQRFVKIELINNEACLAVFQKKTSFDLTPFQIEGQNETLLTIEGWNEQINYSY